MKKIRTGQLAQYNFIFGKCKPIYPFFGRAAIKRRLILTGYFAVVVGAEEMNGRQVNVRNRDDPATQDRGQPIALEEALEKLAKLRDAKGTYNPFPKAAAEKKETAPAA